MHQYAVLFLPLSLLAYVLGIIIYIRISAKLLRANVHC